MQALVRMGLGDCVSTQAIDAVRVKGYVIIKPDGSELRLAYPRTAPRGVAQYLGFGQFVRFEEAMKDKAPRPHVCCCTVL